MARRTALAAVIAALALPATAAAAADPLPDVEKCRQEVGWTVAALLWGEWQRPECP